MIDPQNSYHLEFVLPRPALAEPFSALLAEMGYPPKRTTRRDQQVLYFRDSEQIEGMLAVMEKERVNFIHGARRPDGSVECCGCVANGVDEATANAIFDEMSSFASYAFNKSHAAAYATVAYQTAYLKCHYTKEYMVRSSITSVRSKSFRL